MSQNLICVRGHRWNPETDGRPSPVERMTVCPVCGEAVECFSLTDAATPSKETGPSDRNGHEGLQAADELATGVPRRAAEARSGPPGQPTIPGYHIVSEIGWGAASVVYKARQLSVNRLVALKVMEEPRSRDSQRIERLRREAETLGRLKHPNIVDIYDAGEHGGRPYVALELVRGGDLATQLAGTPLPAREAAELAATIARAVQAAHEAGIIHRDLKPANVLLDRPDGDRDAPLSRCTPKVTDFHLAKDVQSDEGSTRTGAVLGTPSYMAPEQASEGASTVGPAADTYALGAILYETLTGRPPFRAATTLETLRQLQTNEPVPARSLQPSVPRELETICLKCLEKTPERRYASAAALAEDLRRWLNHEPIVARPITPWRRLVRFSQRRPAVAALSAAVVVVAAAGLALVLWQWGEAVAARQSAQGNYSAMLVQRNAARTNYDEMLKERNTAQEQTRRAEANLEAALDAVDSILKRIDSLGPGGTPIVDDARVAMLEDGAALCDSILENNPPNDKLHTKALQLYMKIGDSYYRVNRLGAAEAVYKKSLQVLHRMERQARAATPPATLPSFHRGSVLNNLGNVYQDTGRPQEGHEAYRAAAEVFEAYIKAYSPPRRQDRSALARTWMSLAASAQHLARDDESNDYFQRAIGLQQQLLDEWPDDAAAAYHLAATHKNYALLLAQQKRWTDAEEHCRRALDLEEALLQRFPWDFAYMDAKARTNNTLCVLLQAQRRHAEAQAAALACVQAWTILCHQFPKVPQYRDELAQCRMNLGDALAAQGRIPEAQGQFDQSLAAIEALSAEFPQHADYRAKVARWSASAARWLANQRQYDAAEARFRQSIDVGAILVDQLPDDLDQRWRLSRCHAELAGLLEATGRVDEAEVALWQSTAVARDAYLRAPDSAATRGIVARRYLALALLLVRRCGHRAAEFLRLSGPR
jgi:tetratricopeptide (TPR) repeat protein/tRNA A-37 threonylcarbamoyl transferase component Bud32